MTTISGQKTYAKTRRSIRYKVASYPKLKKLAINLHGQYCNLTGSLHILPDFYIIGCVKCGTTSLFEYLMEHPNVLPSVGKEIDYFGEYYNRGINWYRACFPLKLQKIIAKKTNGGKCITGEATPRYIDYPHSAKRIKKITPNAKFIVLLRNPVERTFSHYVMNFNNGDQNLETLSFEESIEKESIRTKGEYEKMVMDENYYSWKYYDYAYLNQGIYIEKIKNWIKIFPKEQLLVIQSEKLFTDTASTFEKILKFLELPKWIPTEFKKFKPGNYRNRQLNQKIREKLSEFFEPHNQELYQFLGEKFDWN